MGKNLVIVLVSVVAVVVVGIGGVFLLVKYAGHLIPDPAASARRNAELGTEALQAKDYDKAIESFTAAIRFTSNDPVLRNKRGLAYYGKGKYEKAIDDFNAAILYSPDVAEYFSDRGEAERELGRYDDAMTDFNRALEKDAKWAPAYRGRGKVYDKQKEYNKALEEYTQAIEIDAKDAATLDLRAQVYRHLPKPDLDLAMQDLNAALAADDKYADAYFHRGQLYAEQNQLDKAIADFDAKSKLAPDADAYCERGDAYVHRGDADKAMADFNDAIKLQRQHYKALVGRGKLLAARGKRLGSKEDNEKAVTDFDVAQGVDNKQEEVFFERGKVYVELGEYEKALNDFATVAELNPKRADVHDLRAQIYLNSKRGSGSVDSALIEATKALEQEPKNVTYLNHRAAVYIRKQKYEEAEKDLNDALEIDPKNLEAINTFGALHRQQKRYEEAVADYDKAIKLVPTDALSYNNRGLAYYGKRDRAKALADFKKALELNPNLADAHNNYAWIVAVWPPEKNADVFARKPDLEDAMKHAQEAIKLDGRKTPRYLSTLAAVHGALFHFDTAITYETEALKMKNGYVDEERNQANARIRLYKDLKPYTVDEEFNTP